MLWSGTIQQLLWEPHVKFLNFLAATEVQRKTWNYFLFDPECLEYHFNIWWLLKIITELFYICFLYCLYIYVFYIWEQTSVQTSHIPDAPKPQQDTGYYMGNLCKQCSLSRRLCWVYCRFSFEINGKRPFCALLVSVI